MALTRTNRTSTTRSSDGTLVTGSFTPSNNSLLVVVAAFQVTSSPGWAYTAMTITDSAGLTWTPIVGYQPASPDYGEYWWNIRAWSAPVTTGTSMTVTVGKGANVCNAGAIAAVDYTGYNTGSPTGVVASGDLADDGAASLTLSGSPAATSEIFGALASGDNVGGTTSSSPGSGHTELYDLNVVNDGHMQVQVRDVGSTSTSFSWADTATGLAQYDTISIAVEIKEAAGGGGGTQPPRSMHQYRLRRV